MDKTFHAPYLDIQLAPPDIKVSKRHDGSVVLASCIDVAVYPMLGGLLDKAAAESPRRIFLAERSGSSWETVSYREAREVVRRMAAVLIRLGLNEDKPLAILSDNSIEVGLLTMAAHYVGIPVVHTTTAYATLSTDFSRLKTIFDEAKPGAAYAVSLAEFEGALDALSHDDLKIIIGRPDKRRPEWQSWQQMAEPSTDETLVDQRAASVTVNTPARLLFTSGSTSAPKGVMHTHGMLCWNAWAREQLWPFLDQEPLVLLEWLPWSHGFGSSQNFTMVLWHQGTCYIDDGQPTESRIDRMVENIKLSQPNVMFSAPIAYQRLLPYFETDDTLSRKFFERIKVLFYAGADMPKSLWAKYEDLAIKFTGKKPFFASSWGMTETLAATYVHYFITEAGNIGLPLPGAEVKLHPVDDKLELRVRGLGTMPSYWRRAELNSSVFDNDGFFCTGDAGRFADPRDPSKGVLYDGRIGENFKLSSGRWVPVGQLRNKVLSEGVAIVADVVVVGHNRDEAGLLIFLDHARCHEVDPTYDSRTGSLTPALRQHLADLLASMQSKKDGLPIVRRVAVLPGAPLPNIEIGEKGYINQKAVIKRFDRTIDELYNYSSDKDFVILDRSS